MGLTQFPLPKVPEGRGWVLVALSPWLADSCKGYIQEGRHPPLAERPMGKGPRSLWERGPGAPGNWIFLTWVSSTQSSGSNMGVEWGLLGSVPWGSLGHLISWRLFLQCKCFVTIKMLTSIS